MKILAEKLEYFSKKIEKLSKKSQKILGNKISFEIKNSFMQEVKEGSNVLYVKMLDIEVKIPEIKIEGWTPMVAIDHTNENGNIVHNFKCSDEEVVQYRTIVSNCDHCKRKRHRNTTYILQHDNGEKIQVGKTCLIDFLGHKGDHIEFYANFSNSIDKIDEEVGLVSGYSRPMYKIEEILQRTGSLVLKDGDYFSRKRCENMDDYSYLTSSNIFNKYLKITDEGIEFAQKAKEYMMKQDDSSNYIYNCQTLLKGEYVDYSKINFIVSVVGVYFNSLKKEKVNEFYGSIDEKVKVEVTIVKCFNTRYGYGINCITDDGMSITFFDKNFFTVNKKIIIEGVVKEHNTFNDNKSTLLKKVKIIN